MCVCVCTCVKSFIQTLRVIDTERLMNFKDWITHCTLIIKDGVFQ